MEQLQNLETAFAELPLAEALRLTSSLFPDGVVFSSSLGQEDQVLTAVLADNNIPARIFSIDTGRLFPETYETLEKTKARYKVNIEIFFPSASAVEKMVNTNGVNLFYDSITNRKLCCDVRKVEPLNRALQGAKVWLTGLRAQQNEHRSHIPMVEWLEERKLYKINPLLHWSYEEVMEYIREHNVPYNPLHDDGFISIGCAPCTRSVTSGEDPRAGRWWWETSQKECGLHLIK